MNTLLRTVAVAAIGFGIFNASMLPVSAKPDAKSDKLPVLERTAVLGQGKLGSVGGISVTPSDDLLVSGGSQILVFGPDGKEKSPIATGFPCGCIQAAQDGTIYVASGNSVKQIDATGKVLLEMSNPAIKGITGLTCTKDNTVVVGDASSRCFHKFAKDGKYAGTIGKPASGKKAVMGGLRVCCGILDGTIDKDGDLLVAELGGFRVAKFDVSSGKAGKSFGRCGDSPDEFCGCCNPVSVTVAPDGRFVTSEKQIPRLKIYNAAGTRVEGIAKLEGFNPSCGKIDLAVGKNGKIYVLNEGSRQVEVFAEAKKK